MNRNDKAYRIGGLCGLGLVTLFVACPVQAEEIYHWVDENGVQVFSQEPPPSTVNDSKTLDLGDGVLSQDGIGISEEDDPEGYQAHREEMDALWADIEARREARRMQQGASPSPEVIYHYVEEYDDYPYLYPGNGLRPPHRPGQRPPGMERPTPHPSPPATLKRP